MSSHGLAGLGPALNERRLRQVWLSRLCAVTWRWTQAALRFFAERYRSYNSGVAFLARPAL